MRTDTGEAAIAQRFTDRPENRRRSLVTWILVLAVLAVMASGCTTVGPDFVKPEAPTLADWNEMQAPGFNAGQADYSSWWQAFDDPVLHELVERAYRQNLSLQIAGIRIYEARAQLGIAVGNLYPQQQMGFGELRANKLGQASNTFLASENFNSLRIGFDASWEMDIWGKYRRSVQSGLANLAATVASYDNMLVSLTAEVARNYIVIRTFEKRLAIAEQNIKLQEDSLRIAEVRFDNGAVINPGDEVLVEGPPVMAPYGEVVIEQRTARITRASKLEQLWTRMTGDFEFMELCEFSFSEEATL